MFTTGNPQMPTAHTFSTYCPKKKKKRERCFCSKLGPRIKDSSAKTFVLWCGKLKPTEFTGKYWFNTTFKKISYGQ